MASNINPSLTPVNSLDNFRFWCQKVLPLVYDDSLSYYEVLGKMVVQLNDVIDNVNADTENVLTLKDAFLELQTYVNNFFDDIDQLASYAERAEAAQTAANTSAVNAATSASNASASSLAAMDARDTAVAARQAAQTSANAASTAAANANTKANEAAQSAITAQTAQASASENATLADGARSAAQTAASTATSKANEANTSAENAAQSETNAKELVNNVQESLENIQKNTQDISDLKETTNDLKSAINTIAIYPALRNGTTFNPQNVNSISMTYIIPTFDAESITFVFKSFYNTAKTRRFQWTTYSEDNGVTQYNSSSSIKQQVNYDTTTNYFTITKAELGEAKGIAVGITQYDESGTPIPIRIENLDTQPLLVTYNYAENKYDNYNIGIGFSKIPIRLMGIGSISGSQSFCKYNGKYYSADGSGKIYVQNTNFTEEQVVNLEVGHANSFQMGTTKYAYISGWDDNIVYIVDLDTLTIYDTIQLPTTGYTTVAIDDINKIAYIFQRESRPNTLEHYNFIVYDYENQEVIKQRKTSIAYGAMQSCDYLNDRIFVLNGLGTTENPNGYRVYDTNGNVVSEYIIGEKTGEEPEGVFIDRTTKQVLISYIDRKVYNLIEY